MRGLGCGAATGAEAHERWGSRALSQASHGGGEVAAAELGRDSVARGGEVQRGWEWDQRVAGSRECLVGAVEQQEVACGPPWRRVVPLCAAAEESGREGGGRRLLDFFVDSEKSRGPTVKQK